MLRDNLVGLIEPMLSSAGAYPLALCTENQKQSSSDDRPPCLENPRPEGAESTLMENAASPFHAEPKHVQYVRNTPTSFLLLGDAHIVMNVRGRQVECTIGLFRSYNSGRV